MKRLRFVFLALVTGVAMPVLSVDLSESEKVVSALTLSNQIPGWSGLSLGMSLNDLEALAQAKVEFVGAATPSTCGNTYTGVLKMKGKNLTLYFSGNSPSSVLQAMDIPFDPITEAEQRKLSLNLIKQHPVLIDQFPEGNNFEIYLYMLPGDDLHTVSISRYGLNLNSCGLSA